MSRAIILKLRDLAKTVIDERPATTTGDRVAGEAIAAMIAGAFTSNGMPTLEWKKFMQNFAEDDLQLNRLTLQDSRKNEKTIRESCAYIVSNAVCGAISTTNTDFKVDPGIEP